MTKTRKIINDPVFGFLSIPDGVLFQILQHPYMQRLNRIRQLGLSFFVYPGAMHSRFLHSLGAMHLMHEAITSLREKGRLNRCNNRTKFRKNCHNCSDRTDYLSHDNKHRADSCHNHSNNDYNLF